MCKFNGKIPQAMVPKTYHVITSNWPLEAQGVTLHLRVINMALTLELAKKVSREKPPHNVRGKYGKKVNVRWINL